MIKKRQAWQGNYRWGRDNAWSAGSWDFNAVHGANILNLPDQYGLSLIDGTAFVFFAGVDLSSYVGVEGTSTPWKMNIRDKEGDLITGFVGAAGAGETLDSELVTNGTFNTDTTGWTNRATLLYDTFEVAAGKLHLVSDGSTAAYCYGGDNVAFVAGALYKVSADLAFTTGDIRLQVRQAITSGTTYFGVKHITLSTDGTHIHYYTATVTESVSAQINHTLATACELTVDNYSIKQVIDCPTTGVHIVSAKNGATRNWASIGASFNYNASISSGIKGYRIELRRA